MLQLMCVCVCPLHILHALILHSSHWPCVLLGNKRDCISSFRQVPTRDGEALAKVLSVREGGGRGYWREGGLREEGELGVGQQGGVDFLLSYCVHGSDLYWVFLCYHGYHCVKGVGGGGSAENVPTQPRPPVLVLQFTSACLPVRGQAVSVGMSTVKMTSGAIVHNLVVTSQGGHVCMCCS